MRFLILLLTFSTSIFATEVTTFEPIRTNELLFVTTDETLQSAIEKQYMAMNCRPRLNVNGTIREFYFPFVCRAEITKYLLNNGYKPDQHFRTFTK